MSNRVFFTALTLVASLATALVYGVGGILAIDGALTVGTLVALAGLLGRLYGPLTALSNVRVDVMTALVSLRAGLRGPRPAADDQREARRGRRCSPRADLGRVRRRAPSATRRPTRSRSRRSSRSPCSTRHRARAGAARRLVHGRARAAAWPWSARPAPARPRSRRWSRGSTTSPAGAVRVGGHDVRDVTLESLHDVVGVVTQDAHMFHDTIRGNLLYAAPGRHRATSSRRPARTPRSGTSSSRCRTGSTPSSATAATGCPAARSSGSRSPGCC